MSTVHLTARVWASQERASAWSRKVIIGLSSSSTNSSISPAPSRIVPGQGIGELWHRVCPQATKVRAGSCLPPGRLMPGEVYLDFLVQVLELGYRWVPSNRAEEHPRVGFRQCRLDRRAVVDADLDSRVVAEQICVNLRRLVQVTAKLGHGPPFAAVWIAARCARTPSPPPHSPCRSISGARLGAWHGCRCRLPPRGRAGRYEVVVSYRPSCRRVLARF